MHVHALPYLEIQQSVQLVLNDGQRLNQLLRVHGAHHAIDPDQTENVSVTTGGGENSHVDTGENNGSLKAGDSFRERLNLVFMTFSHPSSSCWLLFSA